MKSKLLQWNLEDFLKGLLMSILSPIVAILLESLQMHELSFNWPLIATTALAGGLGYLKLRLFSNNADEFLTKNRK